MNLIKLFQRSTNSKNFIPEIDGLRFFSIITVMLFHLNTAFLREIGIGLDGWSKLVGIEKLYQYGWWLIRMDLGVKVFFAISGFILGMPFLRHYFFGGKKIELKDYFFRRLTRLEPPFVLTLIGFYAVHVLVLHESASEFFPNFLAGLVYSHVFIFGAPNPINPVTWSLETEAQFYLVLPLLFILVSKIPYRFFFWALLMSLLIGSALFRSYTLDYGLNHLSSSVFAYFINFGVGIVFAYFYQARPDFFKKHKMLAFDILSGAAILGLFYFYKPQTVVLNNLLFNVSVLLFFLGTFRGKLSNWFFTRPWVYLLGGMCYTIYLIHYAFFYLIVKFTSDVGFGDTYWVNYVIQILIVFPIILLASAFFYLLVEKPCMDKMWPVQLKSYLQTKLSR